jgi:hypothetical protein
VFHARCSLLEDLAYGLAAGKAAYRDNALRSLEWTFAEHVV